MSLEAQIAAQLSMEELTGLKPGDWGDIGRLQAAQQRVMLADLHPLKDSALLAIQDAIARAAAERLAHEKRVRDEANAQIAQYLREARAGDPRARARPDRRRRPVAVKEFVMGRNPSGRPGLLHRVGAEVTTGCGRELEGWSLVWLTAAQVAPFVDLMICKRCGRLPAAERRGRR